MNIAISKIRPNPNNPRKVITQAMTNEIAASIKAVGLLNPIKVVKLTPEEKAKAPEYDYEVVGGHIRFLACQKLGWTEIAAVIREFSSPEERLNEEVGDNVDKDMFWLEWYEIIESMLAVNPKLTQKQVADRVAKSQQFVSRAIKALPLLGKSAREAIYTLNVKSDGWEISELAVLALIGLARGKSDDSDMVGQALKVALDRKMTEQQAKKLVLWIQRGNPAEFFPADGKLETKKGAKQQNYDPDDPDTEYLKELPKFIQVRSAAGGNSSISAKMDRSKALVFLYGGMSAVTALEQKQESSADGGNKYQKVLPELMESAVASVSAKATADKQAMTDKQATSHPSSRPSPARGEGEKTNGLDVNKMLTGMINQEPDSAGGKAVKFVAKKAWDFVKKRFL